MTRLKEIEQHHENHKVISWDELRWLITMVEEAEKVIAQSLKQFSSREDHRFEFQRKYAKRAEAWLRKLTNNNNWRNYEKDH